LSKDCDTSGITTEVSDIFLDPGHG
jgi:hypothetical protein